MDIGKLFQIYYSGHERKAVVPSTIKQIMFMDAVDMAENFKTDVAGRFAILHLHYKIPNSF